MIKQEFAGATLYLGDCAGLLPAVLAENKVDALISDPPYELSAAGGGIGRQRQYMTAIDHHLDGGFDVGLLGQFDNWFVFCTKAQLADLFAQAEQQNLRWQLLT